MPLVKLKSLWDAEPVSRLLCILYIAVGDTIGTTSSTPGEPSMLGGVVVGDMLGKHGALASLLGGAYGLLGDLFAC